MMPSTRVMWTLVLSSAMVACGATALPALGQQEVAGVTGGSRWYTHYTFVPPMISVEAMRAAGQDPDNLAARQDLGAFHSERISAAKREIHTPPPPDAWIDVDFDDTHWVVTVGNTFLPLYQIDPTMDNYAAMLAADPFVEEIGMIAMRSAFDVRDPAQVRGMTLSLKYRGGFVAYLNGREIARAHVPAGELTPMTAAVDYPLSAFLDAEGKATFTAHSQTREDLDPTEPRWQQRTRSFGPVKIDTSLLQPGVNVLAIQLHRSDYPIEVRSFAHSFSPIGLEQVALNLQTPAANLVTTTAPAPGFHLWNVPLWAKINTADFADVARPLGPIHIEAARNGLFSGMVLAGSTQPIRNLQATASVLRREGGGQIAADKVQVQYAVPNEARQNAWLRWETGLQPLRYDALLANAPAVVEPVVPLPLEGWTEVIRAYNQLPARPTAYAGVPVVVTVQVPHDAAPGRYEGELVVQAPGVAPVRVPIVVQVADWTVPNRPDYQSLALVSQNYHRLADYYDVEPWSDDHWALIEASMTLLASTGNAGLFFDVLTANPGAPPGIVLSTRHPDGRLTHDFSRLEKYLDMALRLYGPERIRLTVLHPLTWRSDLRPPQLIVVNAAIGEAEGFEVPPLGTPEAKAILEPLIQGMAERLEAHGLRSTMLLGTPFDAAPDPQIVAMFRDIVPDAGWYRVSHIDMLAFPYDLDDPDKTVRVGATSRVPRGGGTVLINPRRRQTGPLYFADGTFWQNNPQYLRLHWNRGGSAWFMAGFPEPWRFRGFTENAVVRGWQGVGNLSGDSFPNRGLRVHGVLRNINHLGSANAPGLHVVTPDLLAPGPDGPVHSLRSLNMLEGVQETEAWVVIGQALTDESRHLPPALRQACETLLEERVQAMRTWDTLVDRTFWTGSVRRTTEFGAVYWRDLNHRLFDLAGQVQSVSGR